MSVKPLMEVRGVLSSWETLAVNSLRMPSAFLSSVTSEMRMDVPTACPSYWRPETGEINRRRHPRPAPRRSGGRGIPEWPPAGGGCG